MKTTTTLVLAAALTGMPWSVMAGADPVAVASTSGYADGEMKKIDPEQGKVTIKHGPIENLGMPGMTMVFRADTAVASKFKPGDMVRFKADRVDGALKVTELIGR